MLTYRRTPQTEILTSAIFLVGLITTGLLALATLLAVCWGFSFVLAQIVTHISTTQLLFLLIMLYVVYRLVLFFLRSIKERR